MDKPDVFMPLYIGDYLGGTSRLTTELHGAYLLLIMDYWMNGPLPDDDTILANITKMSPDAWSNARALLKHHFSIAQGCWMHKRVEQELTKAYDKKRQSEERARRAAEARWSKKQPNSNNQSSSNAPSNAKGMLEDMLEECPSPSPSPSPDTPSECVGGDAGAPPSDTRRKSTRFVPPTLTAATEYFRQRGCHDPTEPIKFMNFYESKGWMVGKNKMKNWEAAVRNWLSNQSNFNGGNHATRQQHRRESLAERSWRESEEIFADIEARENRERAVAADAPAVRSQVGQSGGTGKT